MADTGERVPIERLAGKTGFEVWALDPETLQLRRATVSHAFCTGHKPVYRLTTQLGRTIRATANHKFRTLDGWQRLDELAPGVRIGLPRQVPAAMSQTMSGRERALSVATAVQSTEMERLAESDIYWDRVVSVEADGEADVYDLTVPGPANFVADDIIVHNSIEQDADIVMFIYREDMVKEDTEKKNVADVIVAKHRNGPTDTVPLYFDRTLTKFADLEVTHEPLEYGG
jgi:replicative DNA helicase